MPTTTNTPSAELRKLQDTRDKAHAKAREARAERDGWNEETERLRHEFSARCQAHPDEVEGPTQRPKPGTQAARLQGEIKARMAGDNPHEQAYSAALEHFHGFDRQVEQFKVERVRDRLAEFDPDAEAAVAALREAFEAQLEACEQYRAVVDRVHAVVTDTPGFVRKQGTYRIDPRPAEWALQARQALESDVVKPGLSPVAEARLDG